MDGLGSDVGWGGDQATNWSGPAPRSGSIFVVLPLLAGAQHFEKKSMAAAASRVPPFSQVPSPPHLARTPLPASDSCSESRVFPRPAAAVLAAVPGEPLSITPFYSAEF